MAERSTSLTLLERAKANEAGAWERLVRLYSPLVHYWCNRAGVAAAESEDVAQEVFQAAFTGLASFRRDRPGDTFRGWLRGVTRNLVALHFRKSGKHPRGRGGSSAFVDLHNIADSLVELPEEDEANEVQGLYRRALEQVRGEFEERTWQMFWLTVVEDQAPADVAVQMQVSAAAVRKAKSRVLHRLKEEMGDVVA